MGATNGRGRLTKHSWCNATLVHDAPVVTSRHGGPVACQLDGICTRQLALNNVGTLCLVVYPLRLFVYAGL